ncbi:pentapeptide repeat-containing protein [Scytonema hofmannii FACHB-248]|uniref:Pentapeptide repeat-containing protein n=1 Tax=Scytonema hofmannii FACHB-248 TaxID=1842502 RepID=A0ABR8GSK7_9CYAN|nr:MULTISPECIES: pentapeptide repeat-containing protein [Nostocales]MBD2606318.1 pentapeptide repeat-containing protein [Scytonema hofmannii FACHB-248]
MANEEHLAIIKQGVSIWNKWRSENPLIKPNLAEINLSNTNLRNANLDEVDLSKAHLGAVDFTRASLVGANLREADISIAYLKEATLEDADLTSARLMMSDLRMSNFSNALLINANLNKANLTSSNFTEANLIAVSLRESNLTGANFTRANLSEVNFSAANLTATNFSNANLTEANISRVKALETNFTNAILTGVSLEDWLINNATKLDDVICDYVYLKSGKQERLPINRIFDKGEFTKLFQKASSIIELIFHNGVDWIAFAYSFGKLKIENESAELVIQSIENKGEGIVVVKVKTSFSVDKTKINQEFLAGYEYACKILEPQYRARIEDKDKHINQLFVLLQQLQDKFIEIPRLMAEQPRVQQNLSGQFYGVTGNIENDLNVNASEQ